MNFVAIDFETATGKRSSACAVGIVTVENGQITDQYHALIQPPGNEYFYRNVDVHGITASDTHNTPKFDKMYPEIKKRLAGKTIVAHNESFDRSVLKNSMAEFGLDYSELNLADKWECTYRIFGKKLNLCCAEHGIQLNHHEALSDARACALLYLKK